MIVIRQVIMPEQALLPSLCGLLIDAVHGGASVGFLAPLAMDRATRYWEQVLASLGDGLLLWVAEAEGKVVGSVQLAPSQKENGRHRADSRSSLSSHVARARHCNAAHGRRGDNYGAAGRTLLVLDTLAGSEAEPVYRHLGWQRAGDPNYAASPDGQLFSNRLLLQAALAF